MTGRSGKQRNPQRSAPLTSSNSAAVPDTPVSHHSDMSRSKFQPPANRRGLRRRAGGFGASELSLPGGLRMPASLARRWPFSLLLKNISPSLHGPNSGASVASGGGPTGSHSPKSSSSKNNSRSTFSSISYLIIATMLVLVISLAWFQWQGYLHRRLVFTPLENVPPMFDEGASETGLASNLFWGTYRPQLYFGVRHRSPHSLLGGLMWFRQGNMPPQIRHWCDAGQSLIYNWVQHDGRTFGVQEIQDSGFNLITSFLKRPRGLHGGDWTARIQIKPSLVTSNAANEPNSVMPVVSVMFYFMMPDNQRGRLTPIIQNKELIGIQGYSLELGNFHVYFQRSAHSDATNVKHVSYLVTRAQREDLIQEAISRGMGISKIGQRRIGLVGQDKDLNENMVNLIVYEMTVGGDFTLDVIFHSGESLHGDPDTQGLLLTGNQFDHLLREKVNDFHQRFLETFPLKSLNYSDVQIQQGESILANLLGGMGYFHGESLIRATDVFQNDEPILYGPGSLFTATPSRPQFPRGFLWDEGFHQLLISRWDSDVSMEVIAHWLQLMNGEGWIPREQILGWEARAKVPKEFIVQNHKNGNPPTLILPLLFNLEEMSPSERDSWFLRHSEMLHRAMPRLEAWFHWFNTTQLGQFSTAYRWHGRDTKSVNQLNPLTLTSGLDDYPRASHPSDEERHLDLRCWMALFSRLMAKLHELLHGAQHRNFLLYSNWADTLYNEDTLVTLHWDEENQLFSDFGLHSESVQLIRPASLPDQHNGIPAKERVVRVPPKLRFIPQRGYVTLFPLFARILSPKSNKLGIILRQLKNDEEMWTNFGLRSLAKSASLYQRHNTEHDPPYWRGAIWMNMNYLAVRALRYYATEEGPHKELAHQLYSQLRDNLVKNVLQELQNTGFLWEQYDDTTGKGQRAHPFVGWSSLILMIMAEK